MVAEAASRVRVDVSKNASTSSSANDGEFDTSITTSAPSSTSATPSPVSVFTPVLGDAATASCPWAVSRSMSFVPMSPVPPMMTIFTMIPPVGASVTPFGSSDRAPA